MDKKITVILTVWKRKHLEEQIKSLFSQTLLLSEIWVQQTMHFIDIHDIIKKYKGKLKYSHYKENKGVLGRFESIREIDTEYVFIIDDDIIPGSAYLENALSTSLKYNAIVSPHGRIISPETNSPSLYLGYGYSCPYSFCEKDTEVDYGNNSWFFKTEWIEYFFKISPLYRSNGEDIHLSASCKLIGNIRTFIPQQLNTFQSGDMYTAYSSDEHALHAKVGFGEERKEVVSIFRKKGWKLLKEDNSSVKIVK